MRNRAASNKPKRKNHALRRLACYAFAIAFVLAGWEITALILDTPALPTPAATVPVFFSYASEMLPDFLTSLYRVLASLLIGVALALPIGLALGRCPKADALFAPVLYILYPLPKIVILPILLVLLGLGGAPKIALIALTIFFQVIVVMRDAAKAIPQNTIES
ncbi:MAG: ABC transporter permease subunit, partial [Coriobacteriales bacterium]|nr:ABC transporter permease subunit [Coriobacteriales bacterium]